MIDDGCEVEQLESGWIRFPIGVAERTPRRVEDAVDGSRATIVVAEDSLWCIRSPKRQCPNSYEMCADSDAVANTMPKICERVRFAKPHVKKKMCRVQRPAESQRKMYMSGDWLWLCPRRSICVIGTYR